MSKLPQSFYTRANVLKISRELLGKFLVTNIGDVKTSGMITEVEAYEGEIDRASHAYNGRRTKRTEIMYNQGSTAYIYLCYGIHQMFNIVTNTQNIPHAILVRSLEPIEGIEEMLLRRNRAKIDYTLTVGPGSLCQALGIQLKYSGVSLLSDTIWLEDREIKIPARKIGVSRRVGVDYAGAAAAWPYRFFIKENPWVSKAPKESKGRARDRLSLI